MDEEDVFFEASKLAAGASRLVLDLILMLQVYVFLLVIDYIYGWRSPNPKQLGLRSRLGFELFSKKQLFPESKQLVKLS